jgi:hypothetical protein
MILTLITYSNIIYKHVWRTIGSYLPYLVSSIHGYLCDARSIDALLKFTLFVQIKSFFVSKTYGRLLPWYQDNDTVLVGFINDIADKNSSLCQMNPWREQINCSCQTRTLN